MDGMIYTATSAAKEMMRMQTMHANNLANISTTGFKSDYLKFVSEPKVAAHQTSVHSHVQGSVSDLSTGVNISTNRLLDVAIQGDGWFVIETKDEEERLTRNGNFKIDEQGQLTDHLGRLVLGQGGPITVPPSEKIEIGNDGSVTIISSQTGLQPIVIDKLRLVNPEKNNLIKDTHGLFKTINGSSPEPDQSIVVNSGMLESSNVNAVKELTDMILLARQYELHMKTMSFSDENEKLANTIIATR